MENIYNPLIDLPLGLTEIIGNTKVMEEFCKGETYDIPHFNNFFIQIGLEAFQPSNFNELMLTLCMGRFSDTGKWMNILEKKQGKKIDYSHPKKYNILYFTYGEFVYIEQMQAFIRSFTGLDFEASNRIFQKIKNGKAEEVKDEFIAHCLNNENFVQSCLALQIDIRKFLANEFDDLVSESKYVFPFREIFLKTNEAYEVMAEQLGAEG